MLDNAFFDYISSSAVSLVVSGNTGISPFLTLFVLGLVEMGNPELLNMGATMEAALASWYSIAILGLLTLGEVIGKCIPAIDEMIDSAEVFIVPVISVLASMATLGLLPVPGGHSGGDDAGQGQSIDVLGMFGGDGSEGLDGDFRSLQEFNDDTLVETIEDDGSNDFGEGFMTFTKISLVVIGIGLSLMIHFFKMLLRVSSLVCTGGCCQPCITVLEFSLVIFGVVLSILAPAFAIIACIVLLVAAGYVIKVKFCNKKNDDDNTDGNNNKAANKAVTSKSSSSSSSTTDLENQQPMKKRNTSMTVASSMGSGDYNNDDFVVDVEAEILPPPMAPNHNNNKTTTSTDKPDVEAMPY